MADSNDPLCLLVEIVSCSNLIIRDKRAKSSDPYVKVKLGTKDLHQTKSILKSLNPTFGENQNNAFILDITSKELFDNKGLLFKAKDWNRLSSDEDLGFVHIPPADLLKASGETMVYKLVPPSDVSRELAAGDAGSISIRTLPATEADMKKFGKKAGLRGFVGKIQSQAKSQVQDIQSHMPSPKKINPFNHQHGSSKGLATNILVEVVACRDLLVADKNTNSSDPYCKVYLGKKEIHKTKNRMKTTNPIFTPELGSAFIVDGADKDFLDFGLKFELKDWDRIGSNDLLGHVDVPASKFVDGTGDVMEFKVVPPNGKEQEKAGFLLIRCRNASPDDEALVSQQSNTNLFDSTTKDAAAAVWSKDTAKTAAPNGEPGLVPEKTECNPELGEELHLAIEIVSCRNLLAADKNGLSDPYVKILMGGNEIHKTKHIRKTLNPDYSEDHNNKYAFHCYATDLVELGGLVFKAKDWDRVGSNDDLGTAQVPAKDLYFSSKGENVKYQLVPPAGHEDANAGSITIRTSFTTAEDHSGEKVRLLDKIKPDLKVPKVPDGFKKAGAMLGMNGSERRSIDPEEEKAVFIEIVSCQQLIAADKTGASDPYVKIKLGKKDLHETKPVMQTLNPAYSLKDKSTFILQEMPAAVKENGGLVFKVKDWDRVGKNEDLGQAFLDYDTLYNATGAANIVLKLKPPKGVSEEAGTLTLRCRPATEEDMAMYKKGFLDVFKKAATPSTKEFGDLDLSLLVEVVSCWNLPIADLNSSDPYVKLMIGPRSIHSTKPINNTRDPIYTIKHNSVFILDVATTEIKSRQGINVIVKDYDLIGSNDDLGSVVIPVETVLEASGERLEFQLKHKEENAGFIALRIRPATSYDRDFLKSIGNRKADFMGIRSSTSKAMEPIGGATSLMKNMMTKYEKDDKGVKKFRIRPNPDPDRIKATEYMSETQIEREAFQDSKKWIDIGSGDLGKIFIEIIGADGLPNKDKDFGTGNKTDSFVSVVYEDCTATTCVVNDCLSPRWLPWMKRAFVFRMMHPSSNLNVGIFDYDGGLGADHDICGRVSIDLANFVPDTEYVLRYNLYEDSVSTDRVPKGVVILRLRMELVSEKERILANLGMPPECYVNVKKAKDYDLVRQTVGGRHDLNAYSVKTIALYGEELQSYRVAQYYIIDSVISLLFWRGQVPIFGVKLPLHSLYFFFAATTLAERPSLYPSFFWFNTAWFIVALQIWRNKSPNPWHQSKTFLGLFSALVVGRSISGPPSTIEAHQNEKESMQEEETWKLRMEKAKKDAEEAEEARNALQAEHEDMVAEAGEQVADTDLASRKQGVSLDPLKFVLYPVQMILARVCTVLRFIKNVMVWDEPYLAFLLTLASMAIGLVFLFVPWAFLFRWTSRIVAWTLFSPIMKLVDMFYFSKMDDLTPEQRREQMKKDFKTELDAARGYAAVARIQRENAAKLKAVKEELYGKFITRVPVLRMERFPDFPLHTSTAKPYEPRPLPVPERIAGQHLVGTMIPRIADAVKVDEEKVAANDEEKKTK